MPGLCSMCGPRTSRRSCRLLLGDAVNLVSRRAQARDAVAVEVAFPGNKLIDRDVVQHARLIDWHPPAAHGFDDGGLALHGPALAGARQPRKIGPITSACRIDLYFSPLPAQQPDGNDREADQENHAGYESERVWRDA